MSGQFFLNIKVPIDVDLSDFDDDDPERPRTRQQYAEQQAKEYENHEANIVELLEISPAEYSVSEE